MTTATETLAAEFERLSYERYELIKQLSAPGGDTPASRERMRVVSQRMREITATPPDGYSLPKQAADLVAHAEAHGWTTRVQWTAPGYSGEPYVTVQVGRLVTGADGYVGTGDRWTYERTWHSRDCAPGKVRLFGQGVATTPDHPAHHNAPSVKGIMAVITAHPAPVEG